MHSRKILIGLFMIYGLSTGLPMAARAASEAECAIWLCLPAGFPAGCESAYQEFFNRIRKGRVPLPDLTSCTSGPYGEQIDGGYSFGQEFFEPCQEEYALKERQVGYASVTKCELAQCLQNSSWQENYSYCPSYDAIRRQKPNYIKMWIKGDYLGQFWY